MNHPLATLFEQFLRGRTFLTNVTPRTLISAAGCVKRGTRSSACGRVRVVMVHNTDMPDPWQREGEESHFRFSPEAHAVGIDGLLYALTHCVSVLTRRFTVTTLRASRNPC